MPMQVARYRLLGIAPDMAEESPGDFWTTSTGMVERDGAMKKVGQGWARTYFDNANPPLTRVQAFCAFNSTAGVSTGTTAMIYAGNDIAGPRARLCTASSSLAQADVTGATAWAANPTTDVNPWTMTVHGNGVLVNATQFEPIFYGAGGVVRLATGVGTLLPVGTLFGALRSYRYQAIGINHYDPGIPGRVTNRIKWCSSTSYALGPTSWTPAATNDAGSLEIEGARGQLIDGAPLGESFVVYAERSGHVITYVGPPTIFEVRRLPADIGVIGRNCIANLGNSHVLLTDSDVVMHDFSGVKSIAKGKIRNLIFDGINVNRQLAAVTYSPLRREVFVAHATGGVPNNLSACWVYNLDTERWGNAPLPTHAIFLKNDKSDCRVTGEPPGADEFYARDLTLVADEGAGASLSQSSIKYVNGTLGTGYPVGLTPQVYKAQLDMGIPGMVKQIHRIKPIVDWLASSPKSLRLQVTGFMDRLGGESVKVANFDADANDWVHIDAVGRKFDVLITEPAASNGGWRTSGFDIEYSTRGRW